MRLVARHDALTPATPVTASPSTGPTLPRRSTLVAALYRRVAATLAINRLRGGAPEISGGGWFGKHGQEGTHGHPVLREGGESQIRQTEICQQALGDQLRTASVGLRE